MLQFDFLKSIQKTVWALRDFPLPAIVTDLEFQVYWSNAAAYRNCPALTETAGLLAVLSESDPKEIAGHVFESGSYTLADALPLSGSCLSISPLLEGETPLGMLCLLIGASGLLKSASPSTGSKTAGILSGGLRRAVTELFDTMDAASAKADTMNAGWAKSGFSQVSLFGYRILRVTDNIATYNHYQNGQLLLFPEAADLFALLRQSAAAATSFATELEIPLHLSLPDDTGFAQVDLRYFQLAFFNLLHNALLYTKPGNFVTVTGEKRDGFICIQVTDKGLGIPSNLLTEVLRPYYSHTQFPGQSTIGLGLTLCDIIAQKHRGSFSLTSEKNVGTTTVLRFPESSYSSPLPLAQDSGVHLAQDRFSSLYIGLSDLLLR